MLTREQTGVCAPEPLSCSSLHREDKDGPFLLGPREAETHLQCVPLWL